MSFISLSQSQQQHFFDEIVGGTLIRNAVMDISRTEAVRSFDGLIHASTLNWESKPESQLNKNLNRTGFASRRTRGGTIFHDDIQKVLTAKFGSPGHQEQNLLIESCRFSGTPDRIQLGSPVGNILFEFKTTETYEQDKSGATALLKKLYNEEAPNASADYPTIGDILTVSAFFNDDTLYKEFESRLQSKKREIRPKSDHLTQMYTYAWILKECYGVQLDFCCLAYVTRDQYEPYEFWYDMRNRDTTDKVERAKDNFWKVYACLTQKCKAGLILPPVGCKPTGNR